jgi:RHS repeat-associated protein
VAGASKEYVYDAMNHVSFVTGTNPRTWLRDELYAGGWHVGTYVASSTQFNHADWLGTVRVRTNTSGAVINSYTNLPFGDCLDQNGGSTCDGQVGGSPAHFTDQDRDTETGLDHFMFRQYSAVQGRWMHPDPAGMAAVSIGNPQTWNRYAYVMNAPIMAVDPLGLEDNLVCMGNADECLGGSEWGGNPTSYYVDGVKVSADFAEQLLGHGTAALCPSNNCTFYHYDSTGLYQRQRITTIQSGPNGDGHTAAQNWQWVRVPDQTIISFDQSGAPHIKGEGQPDTNKGPTNR